MNQKTPAEMPRETWPITKDDKVMMQDLGRKLTIFLENEFKDQDSVHLKIVTGAFQYIMDTHMQKSKVIGDDFLLTDKFIKNAKLEEQIEEPFTPEPELPEPTIAERRAHLETELAGLDIEEASVAPSASPAPEVEEPVAAPAKDLSNVAPAGEPALAEAPAPVAEAKAPVAAHSDPLEGAVPSPVVPTEEKGS